MIQFFVNIDVSANTKEEALEQFREHLSEQDALKYIEEDGESIED